MDTNVDVDLEHEVFTAQALEAATKELARLVCPFAEVDRIVLCEQAAELKKYGRAIVPKHPSFPGEIASLTGVPRVDERTPAWKGEDVIVFRIESVRFEHGTDDAPLPIETVAWRWKLVGHIENGEGLKVSGKGLLEFSAQALEARMKTMPNHPRPETATLLAAMDAYEQARGAWAACLHQDSVPGTKSRGP